MNEGAHGITLANGIVASLLLVVGLLGPGWLLGHALKTNAGPIGAFLGSIVLLFHLVLVFDAFGIPLAFPPISLGLGTCCAVLVIIAKLRDRRPVAEKSASTPAPIRWNRHHAFIGSAAIGIAAVAVHTFQDPLSGYDTLFRWDFLSRQMFSQGNLEFYPPVDAEDFLLYGWCDGIAPLVSTLYFWAYSCFGFAEAWMTTPIVIGQALLLFWGVHALAQQRAGSAGGLAAAGILATSSVLLWGVAIGQETGLTALTFVAMFLAIEKNQSNPEGHWLIWAGVAAGAGALAREYGLAFVGFGALALALTREGLTRRHWVEFFVAALFTALPWYMRNWFMTGNPLFSHTLGGLLPGNPINSEYFDAIAEVRGIGTEASQPADLAVHVVLLAGVPLVLGIVAAVISGRKMFPWVGAIVGVILLWIWSVGQTSGGTVYSLRVLTPAIALAAVMGGVLIARVAKGARTTVVAAALTVAATDAALRSFSMPTDPYVAWWRAEPAARLDPHIVDWWNNHPGWDALTLAAAGSKILVADTFAHALLSRAGAKPVPLFSPTVRFLFDPGADFEACANRLRANKIRFILLSHYNPFDDAHQLRHAFFRALRAIPPTTTLPMCRVYDLYAPGLSSSHYGR